MRESARGERRSRMRILIRTRFVDAPLAAVAGRYGVETAIVER